MLSVVARLAVVSALLLLLGTVAIVMGFSDKWPNAQTPGAIFFVGGWLLAGLVAVDAKLEEILKTQLEQRKSEPDPDDQ